METAKLAISMPSDLLKAARYNTFYNGCESDKKFVEDVKNLGRLCRNRRNLIGMTQKLTPLQCEEIANSAQLHRDASRPNSYYQKQNRVMQLLDDTPKNPGLLEELRHDQQQCERLRTNFMCSCQCKQVKGQPLNVCSSTEELQFLGSTTTLFFFYTKVVIVIAFVLMATGACYGLATSILNSGNRQYGCDGNMFCTVTSSLSIENRQSRSDLVVIDLWLIVASTIITCAVLRVAKYKAKILDLAIDKSMETPSDFAIKLENLPYGDYNEEQVLSFLRRLELGLIKDHKSQPQPIEYKSIHIVYNMQGARQHIESIEDQCVLVSQMIDREGKLRLTFHDSDYLKAKMRLIESLESLEDLRKKFLAEVEYRKSLSTTCCIVQFQTEKGQKRFIQQYGNIRFGVLDEIKAWWSRVVTKEPGRYSHFKGRLIQIERAPEPEDLIWENCEKIYSLARIVIIWAVTFTIILLSFAAVVGLDYLQARFRNDPELVGSKMMDILNYAIPVVLIMINKLLWVVLLLLVQIEYSHTSSERVVSTINKAIIAQAINVIVLPIIVNLVLQTRMYGNDGLVKQVLDYMLSNCLVPVALLLVDPGYWIKQLLLWISWTRRKSKLLVIVVIVYLSKGSQIDSGQQYVREINEFYEGGDINITGSYVYLAGGLLYASFNAILQPLILAILLVSTVLFFHIKKYLLLRRYNSPEMLSKPVFDNALLALGSVPVFQSVGAAVYVGFIFGWWRLDLILPCAIALFLALINLRNPNGIFDKLAECICKHLSKKTVVQQAEKKRRLTITQPHQRRSTAHGHTVLDHAKRMAAALRTRQGDRGLLLEYHHYNHLDTLLGYHRLIRGDRSTEHDLIKQQLKRFTEEVIDQSDDRFDYPKECESLTSQPLAQPNPSEQGCQ